jgi:hypothetical protein
MMIGFNILMIILKFLKLLMTMTMMIFQEIIDGGGF